MAQSGPRPPEPITYMTRTAADHIINGHFPVQNLPLGGADYRKAFEDLSLTAEQFEAFQILNKYLSKDYPYAVVTRNSLYYRSDDNCSVISDRMGGVDISEACRNHDYCYRRLSSPAGSDQAKVDFQKCNLVFGEEIVKICQQNGKECSLNKIYALVLKSASILVFKKRQGDQAEMVKEILNKIEKEPRNYNRLISTDIFDFQNLVKSYQVYCSGEKSGDEDKLFEKSACDKNTLLVASQF